MLEQFNARLGLHLTQDGRDAHVAPIPAVGYEEHEVPRQQQHACPS
jgi:hypothetical protein